MRFFQIIFTSTIVLLLSTISQAAERQKINIWPGKAPGETKTLPPEVDRFKEGDNLVAGRKIIKLTNVSVPQLEVFKPENANGSAIVICPGGGHHILAYDLEGTETAEWLSTLGVTAFVLKYRVPARDPKQRWTAAVQDAQRSVSLVRARSEEWKIDPKRIGILGYSAGGQTAALASLLEKRQYDAVDEIDKTSRQPNFTVLCYPAYLYDKKTDGLFDYINVTPAAPPMFFVHAFNDPVTVQSSLLLASELKKNKVPTELHIYSTGGHGYGLRETDEPVTKWTKPAASWLKRSGFLNAK